MAAVTSAVKLDDLQQLAALSKVAPDKLARLATVMVRQTYAAGQMIFLEGDPSIGVWFIASGRVKIIKHSENGRVLGLCLMNRGKCFGSCPLFDSDKNPASAQALDDVTLLILPREKVQHFIQHDPELASVLLQIYSQRLSHLARLGESLGAWSAADRINDSLLTYADRSEAQLIVTLTHEKLADLAGTVREVVTRHLSRLEDIGIVRVEPGRIVLLDVDALNYPCLCKV